LKIKTLDQTDRGTNILPDVTWGEGNKLFKKDGYYAFKPLVESAFFKAGNTTCRYYVKSGEVRMGVELDI